jgi:RsiW-degrading membrane proteinase PrsW (M82 family)
MDPWLATLVAIAPVLCFLAGLLWLDGYKLLRPGAVAMALAAGVLLGLASYGLAHLLLHGLEVQRPAYSRYIAPVSEELLKGLVIVALVRASRIGFLVDGAIFGFAVGSGFALFENLHYLRVAQDAGLATWIVRGFGTAIMHGGSTALFAVMSLTVLARRPAAGLAAFLPGLLVAALMHGAFNRLGHMPQVATLVIVVLVPAALLVAFHMGERALRQWLCSGFDQDAEMLELITSGDFANSPPGAYLDALRRNLEGTMVADILCYLRVYTELSLRAKGLLMMRESGFVASGMDDETKARFDELRYLEDSIGSAGMRAMQPLMHMSRQDLWQLYVLQESDGGNGAARTP